MARSYMTNVESLVSSPVINSFGIGSHQNVALTTTNTLAAAITQDVVIISSMDYYRLGINQVASAAGVVLPPGLTTLILTKGDVLNFVRAGTVDSNLSIIEPV